MPVALGCNHNHITEFETAAGRAMTWDRIYMPGTTEPVAGTSTWATAMASANLGRRIIISGRTSATWAEIAAGTKDVLFAGWANYMASFPTAGIWCFYHEPEDNTGPVGYTSADYRAATAQINSIMNPVLHPAGWRTAICYQGYTFSSTSGRDPLDWYDSSTDFIGTDTYDFRGSQSWPTAAGGPWANPAVAPRPPSEFFHVPGGTSGGNHDMMDFALSRGKDYGLFEIGFIREQADTTGATRTASIQAVANYLLSSPSTAGNCEMAMYFEMDESDGSKNNAIRAEPASMSAFAQWTAGTAVSQFGRPEADVLNQSYTTQAGGSTNLYQGLDELVASDTDYIISPVDPSNKVYVTRLSDVTDPLSSVNHVVRYRYRKSGTSVLNLDVQLRQGYASEVSQGTLIASWSHADISTTAVTAGQALSAAEANAISNYIQMHLRFNFNIPSFGPLTGVAAIKAGAGPRTVSSPGGGVSFNTGSNIQTLIDANPANTMFVTSTPGTYTNFRNLNITGDHPRFWFVGAAASYNITGAGERFGFDGVGGIEVRGGTWSGYGVQGPGPSYATPIHATGGTTQSVVEDAILTGNEVGVLMHGNTSTGVGTTVSHCTMSNNFRYGCTGGGSVSGQIANILEYCILDNNNTGGRAHLTSPSYNPGGDASATKFVYGNGDIARYNWVKNNYGFGLWWDSYVSNLLIHDNVCENNTSADIFMEVVYGGTVVEHNYCNNTGLGDPTSVPAYGAVNNPFNNAGILVSCADASGNSTGPFPGINDTSEVRYNDLDCSNRANGVALIDGTWHPEAATRNWSVHHNRIYERGTVAQAARTGLYDVSNRNLITSVAANNHFNYNEYHVATVGSTYYIADSAMTFAQFRAAGHEANGTEVVI